jgi:hypothetical protein
MRRARFALLAGVLPLCGCVSGLLYTHTFMPLTTNFSETPVFTHKLETGESDVKDLRIPWPVSMDVKWHSNAIGDIAKREGIDEICYADIEHLSVFFAIWRQDTVHVYGRAAKPAAESTGAPAPEAAHPAEPARKPATAPENPPKDRDH